ncbi:protein IDA-LIKE 4-like [Pyrus ussuriensis x Pyrus communis]|uniref:Protein IDA-LIKE 4-like n=1 Tax=Pyrus ussuriensis x Pyrus communis TaxID=2448454 RepID=A0A5N5GVY2_9ROSA|nr:protein IDA-LIKE 4-like [Pyrus ussuriensis x Pyrus communis]
MASRRRPLVLLVSVWLCLTFIFIHLGNCHTSSTKAAQVFKFKPKYMQNSGHFLGFFPRRKPIPASGPSRKHNGIGLRSWRSP